MATTDAKGGKYVPQKGKDYDEEVIVCENRYPGSAEHIKQAQKDDKHPSILTIARNDEEHGKQADARRKQSLKGISTAPKYDRDEYPPAMFAEGGTGASVKHVLASDNRGAGSSIGNQVADYKNGTRVLMTAGPCEKCKPNPCEDINKGHELEKSPVRDIPPKN